MSPPFTHRESTGLLHVEPWLDKSWLIHGFTTRPAGDFTRLEAAAAAMPSWGAGGMTLESVRQIHSSTVHIRAAGAPSNVRPRADALLTGDAGRLLTIRTADCVPLLFIDEQRRAVGAVHAGWRGTARKIAQHTVARMHDNFGSLPEDLEVAIGPAIGVCCYEVGPEVAVQFPPISIQDRQPHPHVDLIAENLRQLLDSGLRRDHIHAAERCTHCDPALFHSYRREGAASGRMLALVGIRAV